MEHVLKNQGAFEKIKKEQGAKKNEKGAEKKWKGSKDGKTQGSREQRVKMWREQGARTPPYRASSKALRYKILLNEMKSVLSKKSKEE